MAGLEQFRMTPGHGRKLRAIEDPDVSKLRFNTVIT